jgi:hypothetical protein
MKALLTIVAQNKFGPSHETTDAFVDKLLREAADVDQRPRAQDVEEFTELLLQYWPADAAQLQAIARVVGVKQQGGGYANGFLRGPGGLHWVHFSRELVALQLVVRVARYEYIRHTGHPLCVPLALLQDVARRTPVRYVDFVIDLATTLRGSIQRLTVIVRPDSKLLGKHDNHASMPQADYIPLASLRDDGNLLPYRAWWTSQLLEGAGFASELVKWFRDAGYTTVQHHAHIWWALRGLAPRRVRADRARDPHGVMRRSLERMSGRLHHGFTVVMFGAGSLALKPHERTLASGIFGHAMLVRSVELHRDYVRFNITTLDKANPLRDVHVTWSKIASWYRGFVCAFP